MVRRRLLQIATIVSTAVASASVVLWSLSYEFQPQYLCAAAGGLGHRLDVQLSRGVILFVCLNEYEYSTPLLVGLVDVESPEQFDYFKKSGWWHGENSWWERVGYTVKRRVRLGDFEYASGTFWPPFVWQHPIVPFTAIQLPLWACCLLSSILPARWMVNRWNSSRQRRKLANSLSDANSMNVRPDP